MVALRWFVPPACDIKSLFTGFRKKILVNNYGALRELFWRVKQPFIRRGSRTDSVGFKTMVFKYTVLPFVQESYLQVM